MVRRSVLAGTALGMALYLFTHQAYILTLVQWLARRLNLQHTLLQAALLFPLTSRAIHHRQEAAQYLSKLALPAA